VVLLKPWRVSRGLGDQSQLLINCSENKRTEGFIHFMRDWTLQNIKQDLLRVLKFSTRQQGHKEGVIQYVIPGPALRKNPPIYSIML
jgi:hypothetical protein